MGGEWGQYACEEEMMFCWEEGGMKWSEVKSWWQVGGAWKEDIITGKSCIYIHCRTLSDKLTLDSCLRGSFKTWAREGPCMHIFSGPYKDGYSALVTLLQIMIEQFVGFLIWGVVCFCSPSRRKSLAFSCDGMSRSVWRFTFFLSFGTWFEPPRIFFMSFNHFVKPVRTTFLVT